MKRALLPLALGILVLAVPAQAGAGWKLPKVTNPEGNKVFVSSAKKCSGGKFGTWTFRNALKSPSQRGFVLYKAKLTQNQQLHAARFLRFGGDLKDRTKERTLQLLASVKFRYKAGSPALVQSVRSNGNIQAQRKFNPRRNNC
jgi:hypothetical protein